MNAPAVVPKSANWHSSAVTNESARGTIGTRLRGAMEQAGYPVREKKGPPGEAGQARLAEKSGIDASVISRYLNTEKSRTETTIEHLHVLAKVLGVDFEWLATGHRREESHIERLASRVEELERHVRVTGDAGQARVAESGRSHHYSERVAPGSKARPGIPRADIPPKEDEAAPMPSKSGPRRR